MICHDDYILLQFTTAPTIKIRRGVGIEPGMSKNIITCYYLPWPAIVYLGLYLNPRAIFESTTRDSPKIQTQSIKLIDFISVHSFYRNKLIFIWSHMYHSGYLCPRDAKHLFRVRRRR